MEKKTFLISIIGVCALLTLSCSSNNATTDKVVATNNISSEIAVTKKQFNAMRMELSVLRERNMDITVRSTGFVSVPPTHLAKVTSYIDGYVKPFSLHIGDLVKKGEPLLMLENPDFLDLQQSYLEVVEQLDYLESEYNRQQALYKDNISSKKVFLKAKSDYKQAFAKYESFDEKLKMLQIDREKVKQGDMISYITIYAPISGCITAININPGMLVKNSDVIMEIVEPNKKYLELAVFEKDIHSIKQGQALQFSVPQIGDKLYKAEVQQISNSVKTEDKTITAYASIEATAKEELMIGMFVEANIIKMSKMSLTIPFDAIITEEGATYVLFLKDDKDDVYTFERMSINIIERIGDSVNIKVDGEYANTTILSKGVYDII
jgi:cobalt-zinc-cadmium efflux system membrane fusion protein